jgi:hypothetical protein
MFGERNQVSPSLPSAGLPNPFAAIHADPQALLAYANMLAAYAQQQMQQPAVRQHPVAMPAPQLDAEQQPSPSPKLPAAKRAAFRTLIVCVVIGAAGGFYARGQLPPQQLQPSQQSRP